MTPEIYSGENTPLPLRPVTGSKKQEILPGSLVYKAEDRQGHISIHHYKHGLFALGYRILVFFRSLRLRIREKQTGIRLEASLAGELTTLNADGKKYTLHAGQYQVSDRPELVAIIKKGSACSYFIAAYSRQLLEDIGVADKLVPCTARPLSSDMSERIQDILHHPFTEQEMEAHYDNCIRELLFLHLNSQQVLPAQLSDEDITAIYTADSIIREDLRIHIPIKKLAKKSGINEFKLKKGFRQIFDMGVFQRLVFHRIKYAQQLLQFSNRTVEDISGMVGYSSRNSFITAFKSNVHMTPKQWRIKNTGNPDRENE